MKRSHISIPVLGMTLLLSACTSTPPSAPTSEAVLKAQALGTSYFINNKSDSNCSNSSAGTSDAQPWCDFTPANTRTFQPGDQILLARGATWFQKLELKGSGTASDWITLDAYGSGARPIIRGNNLASDRTLSMPANPNYWRLQNLELSNAGDGIHINYTAPGNKGLHFRNLYIHDIDKVVQAVPAQSDYGIYWSTAIGIGASGFNPNGNTVIESVLIENVETANTTPFYFQPPTPSGFTGCADPASTMRNITIRDSYFHDAIGNISFQSSSNIRFFSNRVERMGTRQKSDGTTGIFLWCTDQVALDNNILSGTPDTASSDMTAVDFEGFVNNTSARGNFVGGNAGSGLEFLALGDRPGDFNLNSTIASNTFVGNNTSGSTLFKSSLLFLNFTGVSITGIAQDNLYSEPSGFTNFGVGTQSFTFVNNVSVASSNLFHSAQQFSALQGSGDWRNQYFNGSSWNDISTWDATNQRWGGTGYVDRFNLLPDFCSSCWVARAWTATQAGTIRVRGRVFKNVLGGDGVLTRISKNGVVLWPSNGSSQNVAGNDQSGFDTNLDNVSVNAGDVVRFEVNNGSDADQDLTSWTPAVGFFPAGSVSDNLALGKSYVGSSSWDSSQTAQQAFDGNLSTNWQAASGFVDQTLEVNFGANTTFNSVTLTEYGNRTQGYRIEYWNGSSWQTAYTGTTIGGSSSAPKTVSFPAVTGSKARIYFTAGTDTPVIYEFEIYNTQGNLALGQTYSSSSNWDSNQTADKAFDGLSTTNWQAANSFSGQTLEVSFAANTTFGRAVITEYGNRTQGYRIEYWNGSSWQTAYTGTTIGDMNTPKTVSFPAVTGSKARLVFTAGIDTPIIYELEFYAL